MAQLTEAGHAVVSRVASQHNVSEGAVESMLRAVANGGGSMAQFSHPEFGGSGQWMRGGMTMVGDMFNNALKATVDSVCSALSLALSQETLISLEPGDPGHAWWPAEFGVPSVVGGQNDLRYAVFPVAHRVLVDRAGTVETYDLGDHRIGGVSQSQDGSGARLSFSSQHGQFDLSALRRLNGAVPQAPTDGPVGSEAPSGDASGDATSAQPGGAQAPAPSAPGADTGAGGDPLAALERLAALVEKGLLSREEFDAKKTDLLARI